MPRTVDVIALALDHRIWAERSTCPAEQRELHRIADIYEVLAMIELPMSTLRELYGGLNEETDQLVDVFE